MNPDERAIRKKYFLTTHSHKFIIHSGFQEILSFFKIIQLSQFFLISRLISIYHIETGTLLIIKFSFFNNIINFNYNSRTIKSISKCF